MQKDRKLNPMQHSAGKIKALVGAYRGTDTALTRHDFRAPFKPYKRL